MFISNKFSIAIGLFVARFVTFAYSPSARIELKDDRLNGMVAIAVSVGARVTIDGDPNYDGYWTTWWGNPIICHSDRWNTTLTQPLIAAPELLPSKLLPLPYHEDTQFAIRLPAGHWSCRIQLHPVLQARSGSKEEIVLDSEEFMIDIQEPTAEDIKFLESAGVWAAFSVGKNDAKPLQLEPVVMNFPNSSYYCHYWVQAFRAGNLGNPIYARVDEGWAWLSSHHPGVQINFLKDDQPLPERYQQSVNILNNLMRSSCHLASREELYYWKTMAYFAGGKFKLAKATALEGRRHAKGELYLKFFTKMASFHDEADFRNAVAPPERQQ